MRADQLLVARRFAPTRSAAQRLVASGAAERLGAEGWTRLRKAGEEVAGDALLRVVDDAEVRFVSRGGLKLAGAIERSRIDVAGFVCLDVGQSTGGFTDALLARGAARVVGVDVGHGQLDPKLAADPRVVALEDVHVRELASSALAAHAPDGGFDLVVADLSFISLAGVLPHLAPWLAAEGEALLLAKPQFEVGRKHVGKGGIVRDRAQFARVEAAFRDACARCGWQALDWFPSPIAGGSGNAEFFVRARAARSRASTDIEPETR